MQTEWPASRVETRDIAELVAFAGNARTHSAEQIEQIAASMREWGVTTPILIDEGGTILAGHGRVEAARSLGLERLPVMIAAGWSEAQKRAYVLADNQLAANAGWNDGLLKIEIAGLREVGFDIGLIGFDGDRIAGLFAADRTADPEATPEPPAVPVSVPGDVWLLGEHRIICGDSTDAATVVALLGTDKPHLMVTDPPYGVEYDANWRSDPKFKATRRSPGGKHIESEFAALGAVQNDDRVDWRAAWRLFPGDVAYVWCASLRVHEVAASLVPEFDLRASIIWRKAHFAIGRGNYHWQHEPCWYAVREGRGAHWEGGRKQSTVWDITSAVGFSTQKEGPNARTGHSTQKPVECMRRPIENNSKRGDAVYEPFSGSGTTIIAAEMTGRRCLAIELNPAYVDVAVRRWQEFAGQTATLQGNGRSFAEIEAERIET